MALTVTLGRAWKKLRWSLAQRGLVGTLKVALRSRGDAAPPPVHPFDAEHGTDTGGVLGGGSLGVGSANDRHITAYAGVVPSRLQESLDEWERRLLPGETAAEFHFVDLGCGKGRALLIARERAFASVRGVELNPGLAEIARRNVAQWRSVGPGRGAVAVEQGDAATFAMPHGPLLVFIYNSFGMPVIRAVLDGLEARWRAGEERVYLLFQNEGPEMPMRLDARLRLVWSAQLPLREEEVAAEPVATAEDVTSLYRWVG